MTAVMQTEGLGKRYRKRWALAGCTLSIPAGHVVGLVGPNGAGKSTLLNLATGMLAPTTGRIEVLGGRPAAGPAQLAKVGYQAQDTPLYAGLPVADHLRLGAHLNPGWDAELARGRVGRLGLDFRGEGRDAVRRAARPARAHPGHREATGAADPGRAGGQPRSAGPPRVPPAPDGSRRRAAGQRRALLAPDQRPGTRLRLRDRAG